MAKMKWVKVDGLNSIAYTTVADTTLGTSTIKFLKINGYIPTLKKGYVDGFPYNLNLEKSVTVLKGMGKVTLTLSVVDGILSGDYVSVLKATSTSSNGVYKVDSVDSVNKTITIIATETNFTNGVDVNMIIAYSYSNPFGSKHEELSGMELTEIETCVSEYRISSFN